MLYGELGMSEGNAVSFCLCVCAQHRLAWRAWVQVMQCHSPVHMCNMLGSWESWDGAGDVCACEAPSCMHTLSRKKYVTTEVLDFFHSVTHQDQIATTIPVVQYNT